MGVVSAGAEVVVVVVAVVVIAGSHSLRIYLFQGTVELISSQGTMGTIG